jgi:hypothetical protein
MEVALLLRLRFKQCCSAIVEDDYSSVIISRRKCKDNSVEDLLKRRLVLRGSHRTLRCTVSQVTQ